MAIAEICGVIHIHTVYSDGGTTVEQLIDAASELKLDYVAVTDHMTLQSRFDGYEKFHKGVLVTIGYEHNDLSNNNHYLVFGTKSVISSQEPHKYVEATRLNGGVGFLAHPTEKRCYFKKYPPYPWTDWTVTGFDGIEIWNQFSEWVENLKSLGSFFRVFYPRRFMKNVSKKLLARWDELNRQRFVSALGGADAHTITIRFFLFSIKIFPIKVELKGVRTHLYISDKLSSLSVSEAQVHLLNAMKRGCGFVSNFRRGDARGSKFIFKDQSGREFLPGNSESIKKFPGHFEVTIPKSARIVLIYNGKKIMEVIGLYVRFPCSNNGLYRFEVFLGKKAWIYTNPFAIGEYPLW